MKRFDRLLALFSCVLLLACWSRAEDWKPAPGPLMTGWAKDVTPDNVWPEYPRPQMVRQQWVNLNGLWDYAIRPKSEPRPDQWDGRILVPFAVESALSGVMKPVAPDQQLWYRRAFTSPLATGSGRLLLHFGAVDWQCTVWVNGQQVGNHSGGYDPFVFDITDAVRAGENELVVRAWDPTDAGWQPRGKQVLKPGGIMYTAVTGIWQTVWLECVPGNHIRSLNIVPDIDRSAVTVTVTAASDAEVVLRALDAGRVVCEATGAAGTPVVLNIEKPKLWSPDAPHLYDLDVALKAEGGAGDSVRSYFGMRKIEVRKDDQGVHRLMLNNRVLFQYGPLDQGWWPDGLYTPASDEAMKYDIVMTKELGMNMARKHVKYEPARWYYWCDKLGLLVWQDMPSGNAAHHAESKENFRVELKAMIDSLRNFPSIVMWVPFNEGWGQHDTPEIARWIQQVDPTRPVNEASGWNDEKSGDVSDHHDYPGPGMRPVEPNRVSVLGEFGGLGLPLSGHTWQNERNWGYRSYESADDLTDAYVDLLGRLRLLIGQGLAAAVYTQTSDVEIEVNGLMTYDRAVVKMDRARITEAARKLYLPPPIVRILVPTSQAAPQLWKCTFEKPAGNWYEVDFDDAAWKSAPGGFGTKGTPGSVVNTDWNTSDIWIRRTFDLDAIPTEGDISLTIHHDEDAEVYINGQLVTKLEGYTTTYTSAGLSPAAVKALKIGRNTIAIHCRQTRGGQFIDAGLSLIVDRE
ncbi:MAG: beta-galactosidase [Planctomycetes bacterium]|nr:beta-galactosidase [Planctomycetota bacterium]